MSHSPPLIFDRRVDALGDLRILPDETLCAILELLSPTDLGRISCVSSVMYILCNEEPLWMNKCLSIGGSLEYKGSWKKTALLRHNLCKSTAETCHKPLQFDGFFSFCLYKRWYRCNTSLSSFSFDTGDLERKENLSHDEFSLNYDGKKPIMLMGLAETWPARKRWTVEQLVEIYGDTMFRLSQKSSKKIMMKFKDYVSYMQVQHDEDPLYIFYDKFGERAPSLLEDYEVPHLFRDDFFDLLGHDQRPPFRWLIIGPERSGASWHVDPGLTTAWNTLLCGRKRWALYPPGRVPAGVTVHVNEEDGDINIESPTSLQWWLDIYPQLSDEDKPIECTQFPGETIYVPSGWWHCVLNLETTIAVTQNYVNKSNFEFVCLDLAPGHRHKGVSRVGFLALPVHEIESILNSDRLNHPEIPPKEEILKSPMEISDGTTNQVFSYDIEFLSQFLEEERNHYTSAWSPNIYIGQREMREWLCKLWVAKPDFREIIWKGACLALNVEKWYNCLLEICSSHKLPTPLDDEKLPVGTGSNPVFVISDNVVKIYVEGGFESAFHGLGTELEFYNLLQKYDSPLMEHVPEIVASGFLVLENGSHITIPWDGRDVPGAISELYPDLTGVISDDSFSFGVLRKMQSALKGFNVSCVSIWPYLVTKRCNGDIFAKIREKLSQEDAFNLASFLGVQLRALHQLPLPLKNKTHVYINQNKRPREYDTEECGDKFVENSSIPSEWKLVADSLHSRRQNVKIRLEQWGDPIPAALIEKAEEYLPHDVAHLLDIFKDDHGFSNSSSPSWIHSDIMDDNIFMVPASTSSSFDKQAPKDGPVKDGIKSSSNGIGGNQKWIPTHIIDFSDLSIGDPLLDVIPLYLDVLRGDVPLLKKFLGSYALPFSKVKGQVALTNGQLKESKLNRISYRAMCYCILHEENVLGAIFSLWDELKAAMSWETVEETVWGELNYYHYQQ